VTSAPSSAASWQEFVDDAPELARLVADRLTAQEHHVLATLRSDGSPRLNGTNVVFEGADLLVGCMPGTRRAADLRRDQRCALHTSPDLPTMPQGDARLDCVAVELDEDHTRAVFQRLADSDGVQQDGEPLDGDLFALRIRSVSVVQVAGEHLDVTTWSPGGGVQVLTVG
jgi:hypothetical protein